MPDHPDRLEPEAAVADAVPRFDDIQASLEPGGVARPVTPQPGREIASALEGVRPFGIVVFATRVLLGVDGPDGRLGEADRLFSLGVRACTVLDATRDIGAADELLDEIAACPHHASVGVEEYRDLVIDYLREPDLDFAPSAARRAGEVVAYARGLVGEAGRDLFDSGIQAELLKLRGISGSTIEHGPFDVGEGGPLGEIPALRVRVGRGRLSNDRESADTRGVERGADPTKQATEAPELTANALPTLPGERHHAAADALRRLLEFAPPTGASSESIFEKVRGLHDRVSEVARLASIDGLNKALAAAAAESKESRSSTVLAVVKYCADQGLDLSTLDLTRSQVADALQFKLNTLKGTRPGSFEANTEHIALIRAALTAYELRLLYEGQFVSVRPATQRNASIQVRLAGVARETVLTDTAWPRLTVSKSR